MIVQLWRSSFFSKGSTRLDAGNGALTVNDVNVTSNFLDVIFMPSGSANITSHEIEFHKICNESFHLKVVKMWIFELELEYSNLKFEYELEYSNLEFEYELEYSNLNSNIAISRFFRWTLSIYSFYEVSTNQNC